MLRGARKHAWENGTLSLWAALRLRRIVDPNKKRGKENSGLDEYWALLHFSKLHFSIDPWTLVSRVIVLPDFPSRWAGASPPLPLGMETCPRLHRLVGSCMEAPQVIFGARGPWRKRIIVAVNANAGLRKRTGRTCDGVTKNIERILANDGAWAPPPRMTLAH